MDIKELNEVQADASNLVLEMFPSTTRDTSEYKFGLLAYWEGKYGIIPAPGATPTMRRAVLVDKFLASGGFKNKCSRNIALSLWVYINSLCDDGHKQYVPMTEGDFLPSIKSDLN
jgi:uncharacterized protein YmfQ (DUF2313 family)